LISQEGKLVAHLRIGFSEDPAPGSAVFLVLDTLTDREVKHVVVPNSSDTAGVGQALAAIRAELAARTWIAMPPYAMTVDETVPERFHGLGSSQAMVGEGEGLVVRFHEPTLTVHDGARPILRAAHPGWSPRLTMLGHTCAMLTDMNEVWGSRLHGVLLIGLHSSGSPHFCPSSDRLHAVRIPTKAR
jgi:hypothetical protein